MSMISAEDPHPRRRVTVDDSEMSYADTGGDGPIAVFLHGNPTSSYLWRNVIKEVAPVARCLAPDLIGMGESGESSSGYRFADHRRYLDAWFDAVLGTSSVFLVLHDWGSALGFHWAQRHPEQVKGIAYMEAIVCPIASWDDWPEPARKIFQAMRSPAGEEIVLAKNTFVERILPASIIREITDEEMQHYRARFVEPGESRRPTLTWPREIPIGAEPKDVHDIAESYSQWLQASSSVPKLFVNADPGTILTGAQRELARRLPNQEEITVKGLHFVQEDSPAEIGEAVSRFVEKHA
jgi:haloalkane dehalogenase